MKRTGISLVAFFVLFVIFQVPLLAQKLTLQQLSRLDRRLQGIIARQIPEQNLTIEAPDLDFVEERAGGIRVYPVIIQSRNILAVRASGMPFNSIAGPFATMRATAADLIRLARTEGVEFVKPSPMEELHNDIAVSLSGADVLRHGLVNKTAYDGEGVIVCIIDTGIDWKHPDFRDPTDSTKSRILYIWDQTLTAVAGEAAPSETGCNYGVEYSQAHINDEIDGTPAAYLREKDINGHGTHVCGTAAGNGAGSPDGAKYAGLAPNADIIIIKGGDYSFPSSNIIDGLNYVQQKAAALAKPVVVNMSLGSNSGAHDGTDAKSVAIDNFCGSGRAVVLSAGNDGDHTIHISGIVPASGSVDVLLTVPNYSAISGPNNDNFSFDIWLDDNSAVTARVLTPGEITVTCSSNSAITQHTSEGSIYVYNYTSAQNTDREIEVQIYDQLVINKPAQGVWTVRLINQTASAVAFHGWLFDYTIGTSGVVQLQNGDAQYTLSNSAASAIIVGSYAHRWRWYTQNNLSYYYGTINRTDDYSSFTSQGPTRTGLQRPDLCAPGQGIISCRSMDAPVDSSFLIKGAKHVLSQGTSMSAPVVTGAAALLLQQNAILSASQIKSLMTGQANTDAYTGSVWNSRWGYGKLNCMDAMVQSLNPLYASDWHIHAYDVWSNTGALSFSGAQKVALRFTAADNGVLSGMIFHVSYSSSLTAPLKVELYSNAAGNLPGQKIGETVYWDQDQLLNHSWNYVPFHSSSASVTAGTDYHMVLSFSNPADNLSIEHDGTVGSNRSAIYNGSWIAVAGYTFRIRPIMMRSGIQLQAKLYLQGPFEAGTGLMSTALNSAALVPLDSPYAEDARSLNTIPAEMVDWLLLQLRSSPNGPVLASKSVLLRKDGRIVADDGVATQVFFEKEAGSYYLVARHRNHLATMSSTPLSLIGTSAISHDFSTAESQNFDENAVVQFSGGQWGVMAGEIIADGRITSADYVAWYNANLHSLNGYLWPDINLDGSVDYVDYSMWLANARTGATSSIP